MRSAGLYEEVRDTLARMFESGAQDPLEQFGLADLLASDDPVEPNAAFAVAEAQGRTGAVTDVVSRIALAGLDLPNPTGYATRLTQASLQTPCLVALLGGSGSTDDYVLVDDNGSALGLSRGGLTPLASPLDPAYLTVLALEPGSGRRRKIHGGNGQQADRTDHPSSDRRYGLHLGVLTQWPSPPRSGSRRRRGERRCIERRAGTVLATARRSERRGPRWDLASHPGRASARSRDQLT
jgi:hypothetical protein